MMIRKSLLKQIIYIITNLNDSVTTMFFQWKLFGFLGVVVLCSANQRLLIDQLRWEFIESIKEFWSYNTTGFIHRPLEEEEMLVGKFYDFDQNLRKIPEDRLYGIEAVKDIPDFLILFSELSDIYKTYEKFRHYLRQNRMYEEYQVTLEDLTYEITNNKSGIVKTMDHVLESAYSIGHRIYKMLHTNYWCKDTKQAPQQVIYNFYNIIALAQLKAYILQQFASLQNFIWRGNLTALNTDLKDATYMIKNLTANMNQSGDVWRCDPEQFESRVNYDQFTRLLQGHIQNEVDMNKRGTCTHTCEIYSVARSYGCYDDESDICRKVEKCYGDLYECFFVESHCSICLSNLPQRRYDFVRYDSGRTLGQYRSCPTRSYVNSWTRWFVRCHYCMCLCDEQGPLSDRYINLRPVLVDFNKNRVVTGLKLVKHNRILHLQIQEGQLLPYGYINQSTVAWVQLDDYTITGLGVFNNIDYFTMTYLERSMALDEITVKDDNHVLTGVRFQVRNYHIHLEIHVSPFDWHTGLVKYDEGFYIYETSVDKRTEIDLSSADIPTKTPEQSRRRHSTSQTYVQFTNTNFDKDAAQTTIPFIDTQEVLNKPAVPLMGAGIYYKGNRGYGGFIAPIIKTYDFGRHVSSQLPLMKKTSIRPSSKAFDAIDEKPNIE